MQVLILPGRIPEFDWAVSLMAGSFISVEDSISMQYDPSLLSISVMTMTMTIILDTMTLKSSR